MKNLATVLCVLLLLVTPTSWAQTSDESSSLADNEPSENVASSAVQERAPGRWIDEARARHTGLAQARLAAQRSGDTSSLAPETTTSGSSSSGTGNLISSLLGGLSSDVIGSLLGGTGSTGSSGSSSGAFSDLPPEVLQMIAAAGIDINDLTQKSSNSSSTADDEAKDAVRTQTSTTTEERDFVVRWADAMLSTIFTSLAVAVQTTDFVELLKDVFRPLFNLPDPDAADGSTNSSRLPQVRNVYASVPGGPCYLRC